jgi:hypothetical protein
MNHSVAQSRAHDPNVSATYTETNDFVIEADGSATTGNGLPGAQVVAAGNALKGFKATIPPGTARTKDILMYDLDGNKKWSAGDALILENGVIDGIYNTSTDLVLLAGSRAIVNGEAADYQLYVVGRLLNIRFHDANGNNQWDDGEDIVVDVNRNMVYNP